MASDVSGVVSSTPGESEEDHAPEPGVSNIGSGYVGRLWIIAFVLILAVVASLVIVVLIELWPASTGPTKALLTDHLVLGMRANLNLDTNLLLVAALTGALGGVLHSFRSIAVYVGERKLKWSWMLFYGSLPFVAAILALLFYFVIRGGLISAQGTSQDLSPYGIAAIAGLVGLFSDQAAEMLKKVFSTVFSTAPQGSDRANAKG